MVLHLLSFTQHPVEGEDDDDVDDEVGQIDGPRSPLYSVIDVEGGADEQQCPWQPGGFTDAFHVYDDF